MKSWLIILLLGFWLAPIFGQPLNFFLGTEQDIYTCSLDSETGVLGTVNLAMKVPGPTFLALSPDHQDLYAALRGNSTQVAGYRIEENLQLTPLNTVTCGGQGSCHLVVDPSGQRVFVANYSSGDIAEVARKPDGTLGERTAFIEFKGKGTYLSRQDKPHLHMVDVTPDDHYLYCCDLGTDQVYSYKFNVETGALQPTNPPTAKVPHGSGCRHLAFGPDGHFVYVNNEMALTVSVLARNQINGTLSLVQTVPMLPAGVPPEPNTSAEIVCHPNGRYLYVSNRTCDTICCFRIATDGTLDTLQTFASVVHFPRSFAIDPSGQWLVAAGQKGNELAAFRINISTGALTPTGSTATVPTPMCVLFAK